MIKTRILLASVLKPVNDARMFHKIGVSLSKLTGFEVHIAGFGAPLPPAPANIFFHPLFSFSRLSLKRLLAPWQFLALLFRVRPTVAIAGTFELLLPGLVYKLFHPCQLVYDIRENYYLNLKSQQVFPPGVRHVLAWGIRALEHLAAPAVTTFFLAERSYQQELPFPGGRGLVLENKFKPYDHAAPPGPVSAGITVSSQPIRLLYSGTISELYGVFEAIELCYRLNQVEPVFTLTIIGHCPQQEVLERVQGAISDKPYIRLVGGARLVPHPQIIAAIRESQVGLLPYHPHPSLSRCLPTKLFEYLSAALPVLVEDNPYWRPLITEKEAGILLHYKSCRPADLLRQLRTSTFYKQKNLQDLYWESEEQKLHLWVKQTIITR
jgi:glycogen(starch) synthase